VIGLGIFLDESHRVAQGLADLGIRKGDRVALWLPNTPAWLALYFACAWLGAIASRSTPARFRSAEIADIIGRSGATRLLAVRSAAEPFPSLRSCFFGAFNPTMDKIAAEAGRRGVSLSGLYGMSEVQALFARQRPEAQPSRSAREQRVMPLVGFFAGSASFYRCEERSCFYFSMS